MSPASLQLTVGGTGGLTATIRDVNGAVIAGRPVQWSSSNPSIATVSNAGVVSGIAPGTTTIIVTVDGKTASVAASVLPAPVAVVTVSPSTASLVVGATQVLSAALFDGNGAPLTGRSITWDSSNPSVAIVNPAGVVTGVSPGTTTVSATSEGQRGAAQISVAAPPPSYRIAAVDSVAIPYNPPAGGVYVATTNLAVYLWWTQEDGNTRVLRRQGGASVGTWQTVTIRGAAEISPAALYTEGSGVFSFYWVRSDSIGMLNINTNTPSFVWPQSQTEIPIVSIHPDASSRALKWAFGRDRTVFRESGSIVGASPAIQWNKMSDGPGFPGAVSDDKGHFYYNKGISYTAPIGRIEISAAASAPKTFDMSAYGAYFRLQRYAGEIWALGQTGFLRLNGQNAPTVVSSKFGGRSGCLMGSRAYSTDGTSINLSGSDTRSWLYDGTIPPTEFIKLVPLISAVGISLYCYQESATGLVSSPQLLVTIGGASRWLYFLRPIP